MTATRHILAAWVVVASLVPAATALAQTDPPAASAAEAAVQALQAHYRGQPTCERVTVEVKTPPTSATLPGGGGGGGGGTSSAPKIARSSFIIRLNPHTDDPKTGAFVGLDLGSLRIMANNGFVVAVHARDPGSYFRAPYLPPLSTAALAGVLPPVPMPQLDLATADPAPGGVCSRFLPYAQQIRWQSIDGEAKKPARQTIRGTHSTGTITLTLLGGKLRSVVIEYTEPAPPVTITMTMSELSPCDPDKMDVDVTRRTRVESLADLHPRPGVLRLGVLVPAMPLTTEDGREWKIADGLGPPDGSPLAPNASHVVLLFTRIPKPGSVETPARTPDLDAVAAGLARLRSDAYAARPPGAGGGGGGGEGPGAPGLADPGVMLPKFNYARVLLMDAPPPDEVLAQLRAAGGKWKGHLLWTTVSQQTIDLFAPGADAAIVILDSESVLRAVVPVEAGMSAASVIDQATAALLEAGAADVGGK